MCVLFYFSFVCLHVCANAFKFKVYCGSAFESGTSGLPYYCTPPLCIPAVIGGLAFGGITKQKQKNCGKRSKDFWVVYQQINKQKDFKKVAMPRAKAFTPVAGPIFGPLSTRLIEGFHFEDWLISRFYFVPNLVRKDFPTKEHLT